MKKSLFKLIPLLLLAVIFCSSCDEEVSNSIGVVSEDEVIELFDVYNLNQDSDDDYYETDYDDVNTVSSNSEDNDYSYHEEYSFDNDSENVEKSTFITSQAEIVEDEVDSVSMVSDNPPEVVEESYEDLSYDELETDNTTDNYDSDIVSESSDYSYETELVTEAVPSSEEVIIIENETKAETDSNYTSSVSEDNYVVSDTSSDYYSNNSENENCVWIPKSGKKYHITSSCSNMKSPKKVTIEEAKSLGYTPCKRCYN